MWTARSDYIPRTAVDDVEMWQAETFDQETIDRELAWAADLGLNTVRVFVNYAVWEADADGLKQRIGRFLQAGERHGIRVVMVLFDDCFKPEPKVGKQNDPVPGVQNSQWVQSPGVRRREDRTAWPKFGCANSNSQVVRRCPAAARKSPSRHLFQTGGQTCISRANPCCMEETRQLLRHPSAQGERQSRASLLIGRVE